MTSRIRNLMEASDLNTSAGHEPGGGTGEYLLVVEDSQTQRTLMTSVLEKERWTVRAVDTAEQALAVVESQLPMAVITDLEMPGMSGLQLVQTLRGTHPSLPVILTTSKGSEDVAADALRHGAASYVPKRHVSQTLADVVRQVLNAGEAIRSVRAMGRFATASSITLRIDNDESLVPKVIARLELTLMELGTFDEGCRMQVAMALDEAITNAIVHGNLEVPSSLREIDGGNGYRDLIERRRGESPYADRRVTVSLDATSDKATFQIVDEGPGFDPKSLVDCTDEEHIEGVGGTRHVDDFRVHGFGRTQRDWQPIDDGQTSVLMLTGGDQPSVR